MGKLIILEGSDGSGKQTQTELIFKKLIGKYGEECVKKISFPNYNGKGSEPVKMYLSGEFGKNVEDINPYSASVLYSVDRFASYKTEWEKFYKDGGIVISDRYTTSNMVHQLSKIEDEIEGEKYLKWLVDLEWNKMELPKPDLVFFLNMPYEYSQILIKNRNNKITGESQKDIHERDENYLRKSYETSKKVAQIQKWNIIECVENGRIRSIEEISEDIFKKIESTFSV